MKLERCKSLKIDTGQKKAVLIYILKILSVEPNFSITKQVFENHKDFSLAAALPTQTRKPEKPKRPVNNLRLNNNHHYGRLRLHER